MTLAPGAPDTSIVPNRNPVYEAIVLRARESPAGDRILTLMTPELGLLDAFVFGGPKSKLRSLASPYATGRAFVYLDPVKDFRKLSDFEVSDSFPALREDLDRLWAACLMAEILIKTSGGGGDYPRVFALARDTLRGLDTAPPGRAAYPIVLFCWRLVYLLGLGPDPDACVSCGESLVGGGAYSFAHEGFLCPACSSRSRGAHSQGEEARERHGPNLVLGSSALRWLDVTASLPFGEAVAIELDPSSLASLKDLAFGLARRAVESPLASFSQGAGL